MIRFWHCYNQELIIEEAVPTFAMKHGPKVPQLSLSLQEGCLYACINFQLAILKVTACSLSTLS